MNNKIKNTIYRLGILLLSFGLGYAVGESINKESLFAILCGVAVLCALGFLYYKLIKSEN